MDRKDVTPNKNGLLKKFGIGIAGGVIGGSLAFGGLYAVNGNNLNNSPSSSEQLTPQDNSGDTTVSNVSVNVNSDITEAVEKVQNAVVSVVNMQRVSQNSNSMYGGLFDDRTQSDSESSDSSDADLEAASEGSGVVYKKDGDTAYIVTNNHVVSGAQALEIVLHDGTKVQGELVGTDSYTDLAVIKISSDKVDAVAEFGDSDNLKIGEPAIAIGSPLGSDYANSVTQGIVSSLNRNITNTNDDGDPININAIQTDAAINPGNSGGPLVNIEGQVIGINSVKIVQSSDSVSVEGMGFAIPSNDAVSIINQLEKDGKVTRPALGVTMIDMANISAQQREQILNTPEDLTTGVVLRSIQSATPAEKAGLEKYDVITKIDGEDVETSTDVQSALYKKKVGDSIEVTFYRGSKEQTVTVELTIDQEALNNTQE
ncbi:S1C family serine protease [Enterococcus sp. CWB-B31]|uniref:S1C family serine protease n=1 Tax=Enterococcus sp. CWB-B31 TaxID=2885159 RepID=UPI001E4FC7B2|nr:trypsin-like peptidase domain-containing protein [Enterococcus sp. CWB-B31]MCB5953713.1 trypsin-like peptidase domain-containing protein [Enterococcus sp. CWB-B31]